MDFNELSKAAYDPETGKPGTRAALDELWRSVLQLEYWHFLIHPDKPMHPHVYEYEGHNWVLVFTDNNKLNQYARETGMVTEENKTMCMSIPSGAARQWLAKSNNNIYGVRFNEGEFGWYSPTEVIEKIYQVLFEK